MPLRTLIALNRHLCRAYLDGSDNIAGGITWSVVGLPMQDEDSELLSA